MESTLDQKDINQLEAKAEQYRARYKDGKFDEVISELTPLLPKLPDKSELRKILSSAYLDRGAAMYQVGRKQQALSDWETAAQVNSENYKALVNLSTLYSGDMRFNDALNALEKAFQINPELNNNPNIVDRLKQMRSRKAASK